MIKAEEIDEKKWRASPSDSFTNELSVCFTIYNGNWKGMCNLLQPVPGLNKNVEICTNFMKEVERRGPKEAVHTAKISASKII